MARVDKVFGFVIDNKGKTSGSRTVFVIDNEEIEVHKPHPSNTIKKYVMKKVLNFLVYK
jgi:hypothetical protein